jgi:hypothetical protein
VGLQANRDGDHAELVGVAAGTSGAVLARSEILVLLGLEGELPGALLEDVKGFFARDLEQLRSGAGTNFLRTRDRAGLVERHFTTSKGVVELPRIPEAGARRDRLLGPCHGGPAEARDLGGIFDPAGQHRLSVGGELSDPGVAGEQAAGRVHTHELGLEVGVGLLDHGGGLLQGADCHGCIQAEG